MCCSRAPGSRSTAWKPSTTSISKSNPHSYGPAKTPEPQDVHLFHALNASTVPMRTHGSWRQSSQRRFEAEPWVGRSRNSDRFANLRRYRGREPDGSGIAQTGKQRVRENPVSGQTNRLVCTHKSVGLTIWARRLRLRIIFPQVTYSCIENRPLPGYTQVTRFDQKRTIPVHCCRPPEPHQRGRASTGRFFPASRETPAYLWYGSPRLILKAR